jgi:hypothetical protein
MNGLAGDVASVKCKNASAASSAAATRPSAGLPEEKAQVKEIQVFLDRFGMIRFEGSSLSMTDFISRLQEESGFETVLVVYEPISFQRDRQRLMTLFADAFPGRRMLLEPMGEQSKFRAQAMPVNQPAVQSRVLSQQNHLDERVILRHLELAAQFQKYVTSVIDEISRVSSEAGLRYRKEHQLTTQNSR